MRTKIRTDISLEEIKEQESKETRKHVLDRIRAVRLAAESKYQYIEIARILGKTNRSYVQFWIKRFNDNGFEGFETVEGQGRPTALDDNELYIFEQWLSNPSKHGYNVWTAPRLMEKIQSEFKKKISEQCIYDTLERLKYKHRKARPTPSKANHEELEFFKKGSSRAKTESRGSREKGSCLLP